MLMVRKSGGIVWILETRERKRLAVEMLVVYVGR